MSGVPTNELVIVVGLLLYVLVYPWLAVRVARRTGLPPSWGLAVLVLVVGILVVWVFAFVPRPARARKGGTP
jgi:multisubunit Na+/H+ antiporter MnhB subunit